MPVSPSRWRKYYNGSISSKVHIVNKFAAKKKLVKNKNFFFYAHNFLKNIFMYQGALDHFNYSENFAKLKFQMNYQVTCLH